jgi:hypothetical protein
MSPTPDPQVASRTRTQTEAVVYGLLGLAISFFLAAFITGAGAFLPGKYGTPPRIPFRPDHPVAIICGVLALLAAALWGAAVRFSKQLPGPGGTPVTDDER